MLTLSPVTIYTFQQQIFSWYKKNKRALPWRQTRDPYKIFLSEIMLQQTQVGRVIPKYEGWLQTFPTLASLAKADTYTILQLWSGLGYNRRVLFLRKAAQVIVHDYNGVWPQEPGVLQKLPGIGDYTASAIACFAFNKQTPVIDTNVKKVIAVTFLQNDVTDKLQIEALALQLLPVGKAYEWNQALMDYASLVLKKEKITLPKQTKFKGSNRYYRGQIVKFLTEKMRATRVELSLFLHKDQEFVDVIVTSLIHDGFIKEEKGHIIFKG